MAVARCPASVSSSRRDRPSSAWVAFVANARNRDALQADSEDSRATVAKLQRLVPTLRAVGLFDVFEPRSELLQGIVREADGMIPPEASN